jgi:hypothetical protein
MITAVAVLAAAALVKVVRVERNDAAASEDGGGADAVDSESVPAVGALAA